VLRYNDYVDHNRTKTMHLGCEEFVRRYLLQVLPKGFTRIRHFGFLVGCCHRQRLAQIREALGKAEEPAEEHAARCNGELRAHPCPLCKIGHLRLIGEVLPRQPGPREIRRR
jgi:hypothetical protein